MVYRINIVILCKPIVPHSKVKGMDSNKSIVMKTIKNTFNVKAFNVNSSKLEINSKRIEQNRKTSK